MENMESQIMYYTCTEPAQGQTLMNQTLRQLEAAKRNVESLRANATEYVHGHNYVSLEAEVSFLRYEVGRLKHGLEFDETKLQEEQIRNIMMVKNAYESIKLLKLESRQRKYQAEVELMRKEAEVEELKEKLMDKEIELQGIVDENESLKIGKFIMTPEREHALRNEFRRLSECIAELNHDLMQKKRTLQSVYEENEMLKIQIGKAEMRLDIVTEEVERSNEKAETLEEQLEVVQAEMSETKAEVRMLRVQSDQWKKTAEAATGKISEGNNGRLTERSLSLESNFNRPMNRYSTFVEEIDHGIQKKKNSNMLKKIKGLWKKYQK